MKDLVIINKQKVDKISVRDHGFLYGDGVFDTIRSFNKKAFRLNDHLDRLFFSAQAINLKVPSSKADLKKLINDQLKKIKEEQVFIRIIVTRGEGEQGLDTKCQPNIVIIFSERSFCPLKKIDLVVSGVERINKKSINPQIKSLNYENLILAKIEAKKKGAIDAILLDSRGLVAEATTSNVFMVKKGKIFTPSTKSSILKGITRKVVIENFKVTEKNISPRELLSADEVFLTGTANFITSAGAINGVKMKNFNVVKMVFEKIKFLAY
jgi:branched-chain amino acid aminotransferase